MNRITLIGRLTEDPKLNQTTSGVQVCKFNLAVNRRFNREEADFFPISVWREGGENAAKYLKKGSQVAISGAVQIRRYEDNEGIKRTAIEVVADEVVFLTPKSEAEPTKAKNYVKRADELEEIEDVGDIPF